MTTTPFSELTLGDDAWVRWARFDALTDDERALRLLSPAESRRFDTTVSPLARQRLLWGRMLLRELLAELSNTPPQSITLVARCEDCGGPHGRVRAPDLGLVVGVAACAGAVVVVAARVGAIGVDLERRDAPPARVTALRRLLRDDHATLRQWTEIEAVLKADGRGLRVPPERVRLGRGTASLDGADYGVQHPELGEEFVISVARGAVQAAAG